MRELEMLAQKIDECIAAAQGLASRNGSATLNDELTGYATDVLQYLFRQRTIVRLILGKAAEFPLEAGQ